MARGRGSRWQGLETELRIGEVREDARFQLRANGTERPHVRKLQRVLRAGQDLPPIRVAQIGAALYVVDGFHRLEAHGLEKRKTVGAIVCRMGLAEALEEAEKANTEHGLNLSREDKQLRWNRYVEAGRHLAGRGTARSIRAIERELHGVVGRETIRKRLRAMELELSEEDDQQPWQGDTEEDLQAERAEEAEASLRRFGELFPTLEEETQRKLLGEARELVDRLELTGQPEPAGPFEPAGDEAGRLDI